MRAPLNADSANSETTAFDYDNAGQLVRATAADGGVLRYYYDPAHRLTEIADGLGNVIQYTLDAMGNRIKEDVFDPADRLQKTQRRVYDVRNRLYNELGAAGQKFAYSYDENGNLKTEIDPLGRSAVRSYDPLHRLLTVTDAAGGVTRYGYDAKDRLASVQDPLNLTTAYTYDGLGNLTRLASPDTGIATYVPDAAGNIVGSTDARGLATSYGYDGLGRQTYASFSGGVVAFEYDNTTTGGTYAKGRLTRITDPSGATSYRYDAFGRVVQKKQTVGSGCDREDVRSELSIRGGAAGDNHASVRPQCQLCLRRSGARDGNCRGGAARAKRRNVCSVRTGAGMDLGRGPGVSAHVRHGRSDRNRDRGP